MTNEALQRFCESRHRLLIVIAGTFVVGLVMVIPLVDVYRAERNEEKALIAELNSARQIADKLGKFESRVAEKLAQVGEIEVRTVSDGSLAAVRARLVELAKEAGCSIRRMSVAPASSRPWVVDDDPIAAKTEAKRSGTPTGFLLEWRPISISLSGSSSSLHNMLERIAATGLLMHTKSLEMFPSSPSRQSLTIDMELWCYTLSRGK
jgi:hypothetical protein